MLKVSTIFQSHMVLQRGKPVTIWGQAEPNTSVTVIIQEQHRTSQSDESGHWKTVIGPLETSFSERLSVISANDRIDLEDIQIGEVWLAAGQSNMEFFMRYDADYHEELSHCENDAIRFFDYPEVSYPGQIDEADYRKNFAFWRKASPENLEWFSAVGYYFAKEIQKKYAVPVGIIGCNWGGTVACAWMSEQAILEGGGKVYLDEYQDGIKDLDLQSYEDQLRRNPMFWKVEPFDPVTDMLMRGMSLEDLIRTLTGQAPGDLGEMASFAPPVIGPKSESRPTGLYESMLCQIAPYGIRGILFYQGESDGDRHPEVYDRLFPALIRCFRSLWLEELPFLFVQIAPFGHWMQSSGEPYVAIREAQQHVSETVPNTGMAVISDIGMELDIHPKKKQPVGRRLALLAQKLAYGEDVLCQAPMLISAREEDGKLLLRFDNTGDGLTLAAQTPDAAETDPTKLGGLQILCGEQPLNLEGVTATAEGDTVTLHGVALCGEMPVTAALGCTGWYRINLYNSAELPARPSKVLVKRATVKTLKNLE